MDQHPVRMRPPWLQCSVQLLARGVLIGLLVVPVTLALPATVKVALAAPLEDCDADGFDDATGVAVPWAGFDETRGDTPAGPGTADWWIAQNAQSGSGGGSGSSGSDGSSGSSDSGGGAGSSSGSGKSAVPAATRTAAAGAKTAPSAAADTGGAAAPAAVATLSGVPTSQDGSASAESTYVVAAVSAKGPSGPAVVGGSLWEALTVGFTGANDELFAGLSLLAALALAGGLALGVSALRGTGTGPRRRKADTRHPEEPVADVA